MKKVYSYLLVFIFLFTASSFFSQLKSQSLDWAARFSRDVNGSINDFEILPDGSVIVIGYYDGRMKFEGVNSRITVGPNCNYCPSAFAARINNQGKVVWYNNWPNAGASFIRVDQMELDHNYDIIIGGAYKGSYDLDPSPSSAVTPGGTGLFLMKLDTAGAFLSSSNLAGSGNAYIYEYNVNHLVKVGNEFFMAGDFETVLDVDPSPSNNVVLENNGINNLYLVRYDSNLNYLNKSQNVYSSSNAYRVKAQADGLGNVYLLHSGSLNGNPNAGDVFKRYNSALQNDSVINLDGIYVDDFTFSSSGELSFVGYSLANSNFSLDSASNPSIPEGYCVAVYDSNAKLEWKKVFPNVGINPLVRLESVTSDNQGNTIFGGIYDYDLYLDSTTTTETNTANTNQDGFFASFDATGAFNWSYSLTAANTTNSFARAAELRIDNDKLYLLGYVLRNALNFNPFGSQLTIPNRFTSLVIQGQWDPFMQKIDLGLITSLEGRSNPDLLFKVYPNPAVSRHSIMRRKTLLFGIIGGLTQAGINAGFDAFRGEQFMIKDFFSAFIIGAVIWLLLASIGIENFFKK